MSVASVLAETPGNAITKTAVLHNHHTKTLDAGSNGSTVSCGAIGDILQMSCYHPTHGLVVCCPFSQFDGARFHDPRYVREYRKKLLGYIRNGTRGFGINFKGQIHDLDIQFVDNQWILTTYFLDDVHISTTVFISERGEVVQSTALSSKSSHLTHLDYELDLSISVNRASYGQLTEGGPLPLPPSENDFQLFGSGRRWAIINKNLDALVEGCLYINELSVDLGSELSDEVFHGKPTKKSFHGRLKLHPYQKVTAACTFKLQPGTRPFFPKTIAASPASSLRGGWKLPGSELGMIIRRNFEYILGNCTLSIGNGVICFIADHVALPLGWNRDNYWQIRFLLDVYRNLNTIATSTTAQIYSSQIRYSVKGHLEWVFRLAHRPHGYWHRSYLATGVPKDGPIFQLDQQCYPLLELCDFYDQFPSERLFVGSILAGKQIPEILQMLDAHRDKITGLYVTEETPGDDAVEYPFHFSSHVLLWHTFNRLASLLMFFPDTPSLQHIQLKAQAELIRSATLAHFVANHSAFCQTMFAYLTDGAGHHKFYHDANDIPTLFARDWKFINTPNLHNIWSNTMSFGLSPLNAGGYYLEGQFGGLGSVHTKGPWPLGYAQEFIYAHLTGNKSAQDDSWRRIKGSMFWDGLFPEAVDCHTGDCVSKAWFSWPGSMIGSALLRFSLKPDTN